MDTKKFDAIAKNLAAGTSRRTVIGGLFGGALAMTGLSRAAGKPADKVDICHYDAETASFHLINVSGNALEAHMNHGDLIYEPSVVLNSFTLNANNQSSVNTGVFIAEGESVTVTITGEAWWSEFDEDDANGKANCVGVSHPFSCGSVVGVIGGGNVFDDYSAFFMVGTSAVVTGTGGNLFLQYADGCKGECYGDNLGSLQVTISTVATC